MLRRRRKKQGAYPPCRGYPLDNPVILRLAYTRNSAPFQCRSLYILSVDAEAVPVTRFAA